MQNEKPSNPEKEAETTSVTVVPDRELRHPGTEVSLSDLASLKGEAVPIIEARIQVLTTLRKAAIRATSPEDWLLFRDRKGAVIGYLQDCGCDRIRDLYGIQVLNVGKPEKITSEDGESFTYLITGAGYCSLTKQNLEAIEGGRSSGDDFVKGKRGVELELAVRKAARANLDGNITRELAGLKSVPMRELEAAWADSPKRTDDCRLGRGFGSQGERMGADLQTGAGGKQSEAPKCPKCQGTMKFVQAKEGKYEAFWSCLKYSSGDCDGTRKFEPAGEPEPESPGEPRDDDPGPQEEDQGVHRNDVNF